MHPNRRYRIGFIGGGINSAIGLTHFAASRLDGLWELESGFFSRNNTANESTGSKWGIDPSRTYKSLESFMRGEAGQLDAVAVLTPIPSHWEITSALLQEGFSVISEKPITGSVDQAVDLCRQSREKRQNLLVTLNYSGYPMLRELRARILKGQLGKIHSINIEMPQEGFLRRDSVGNHPKPQVWRTLDGEIPTVSLDLGIHVHHVLQFLLGIEPNEVVALQGHSGLVTDVIDDVHCLATLPGGVTANLWFGKTLLGARNGLQVRVAGDEGACTWTQMDPEHLYVSDARGQRLTIDRSSHDCLVANANRYGRFKVGHPAGFIEAFANLYADMAAALGQQGVEQAAVADTFVTRGEKALAGMRMMAAISQSAQTREWERVPSADSDIL